LAKMGKVLTIRGDNRTYGELVRIARERRWPIGEVVRDAIYEYLDRQAKAKIKRPASIFG